MIKATKKKLANGLRIITLPHADSLASSVFVFVETGSKYETKEINGISHFLEHMCFKGTKNRPRSIDIASELDGIGAAHNAFTSHEYTGYFAKAQPKHFDKILDVVSDIYLNQLFDPAEIEKEKGVIAEEINMYEDTPARKISDYFLHLLYGDQPAGWDVAGRKEVIAALKRDDFVDYHAKHYVAEATIVVAAGAFDEKEAMRKIEEKFSVISAAGKHPKIKTAESQSAPRVFLKMKESDQTHLILGFRAFDIFDERRFVLDVLADILGGGMSSRLFQRVREEMGAAYYVYADADLYTDHGYLAAGAGVDNKKAEDVVKAILEEFLKLAEHPVGEEELRRAKDHMIGGLMIGLETSNQLASFYGGQEVARGSFLNPSELSERIEKVTAGEILALAKEIIRDDKLNLALIGPFKNEEKFAKILKTGR